MESFNLQDSALTKVLANDDNSPLTGFHLSQGYGLEQNNLPPNQLNRAYGMIEEAGNTSLYKVSNGDYYAIKDYIWNSIDFNDNDGWSIIGAEQVNRTNQIVFENSVNDTFYIHNLDSEWAFVSGDWLTGTSFYQAESNFEQD